MESSSYRIPSLNDGGKTQKRSCRSAFTTNSMEPRQDDRYFNSAAYSSDGRAWFAQGNVVQMVDPSRLSRKAPLAMTYIQSLTVDRKEFAATGNLKLSAESPRFAD